MTYAPSGHIEQLPSGSWRAKVYAGKDPLSGRELRFRKTRRTEVEAQIELGRLLELARAGRQPDSDVTVAELLDEYVPIAGWDVSTEETNLGYIRRTIKPALGSREVRKVRGPLLDNLYARLQKCGNLACAGKPFTEHRHVPDLRPGPSDRRLEWEQAAGRLREAIACGALVPGDALPSVPELGRLQGLKPGTIRHAFLVLEAEGLLVIHHGRTTQVAGEPPGISDPAARYRSARSRSGHDCQLSGCRPHACKPMSRSTIHTIHSILSGAFDAAERWEWVDFNPAGSAKPPTVRQKKQSATLPAVVVKVIKAAPQRGTASGPPRAVPMGKAFDQAHLSCVSQAPVRRGAPLSSSHPPRQWRPPGVVSDRLCRPFDAAGTHTGSAPMRGRDQLGITSRVGTNETAF